MKLLDYDGLASYTELLKSRYLTPLTAAVSADRTLSAAFISGGINSDGSSTTNAARARSNWFSIVSAPLWLFYIDNPDYQIVNGFKMPNSNSSAGSERVTHSGVMLNEEVLLLTPDPNKLWMRFSFKRVDEANISSEELAIIKDAFKMKRLVDPTLSITGAPADAKTVGDRLAAIEARLDALENA